MLPEAGHHDVSASRLLSLSVVMNDLSYQVSFSLPKQLNDLFYLQCLPASVVMLLLTGSGVFCPADVTQMLLHKAQNNVYLQRFS